MRDERQAHRPARHEARELVHGVPGEGRRATRLGEHRGTLRRTRTPPWPRPARPRPARPASAPARGARPRRGPGRSRSPCAGTPTRGARSGRAPAPSESHAVEPLVSERPSLTRSHRSPHERMTIRPTCMPITSQRHHAHITVPDRHGVAWFTDLDDESGVNRRDRAPYERHLRLWARPVHAVSEGASARLAALVALGAAVLAAVVLVATLFTSLLAVAAAAAALVVAGGCAWIALTRSGVARMLGVAAAVLAIAASATALYLGGAGLGVAAFLAAIALFTVAARSARRRSVRSRRPAARGTSAPPVTPDAAPGPCF